MRKQYEVRSGEVQEWVCEGEKAEKAEWSKLADDNWEDESSREHRIDALHGEDDADFLSRQAEATDKLEW